MLPSQWSESKLHKIREFDPNGIGHPNGNLFGLPFTVEESTVVIIPAPWEVTASFRSGAANAPAAILEASYQIDLYDAVLPDAWKYGIGMLPMPRNLEGLGRALRRTALECIQHLEQGGTPNDREFSPLWQEVNRGCEEFAIWVKGEAKHFFEANKLMGILGGDHSVALGLMQALADRSPYGVLQIDAHFDLRNAYEGFWYSHASVMRNATSIPEITRFVHVGVRDYCQEEVEFVEKSERRCVDFTDRWLRHKRFSGTAWSVICDEILDPLPENVYVSFDIDGLDPTLCPHTGTPVPGGLGFEEAFYLLEHLVESGRTIIGFDLSEVAPASDDPATWSSDWDANVGMRVLYRLANLAIKSNLKR